MAERIVSPGVFTREKDLSFLPAGIAQLGAAIVGPTLTGPAMIPTQVTSYSEFENKFGTQDPTNYTAYTVKSYLQRGGAPSATIVRTLGNGGYSFTTPIVLTLSSSEGSKVSAVLLPTVSCSALATSFGFGATKFTGSNASASGAEVHSETAAQNISLVVSGAAVGEQTYSISLKPSDSTYITKVFGTSPNGSKPVYVALNFENFASASFAATVVTASVSTATSYIVSGSSYGDYGFTEALTPYITDQSGNKLFRFHTFSDGTDSNSKFKVSIANIKESDIGAGGDDATSTYYSSFTVQIRTFSDTDSKLNIVETFSDVNLNKNSKNYIGRRIGDKYLLFGNDGKIISKGNYTNLSKYVYIEMFDSTDTYDISQYPFGYGNLYKPANVTIPLVSHTTTLSGSDGTQNTKIYFGFNFTNTNNLQYINPAVVTVESDSDYLSQSSNTFLLSTCYDSSGVAITVSSTIKELKFTVPFHTGFDGMKQYVTKATGLDIAGTNVFGFNLNSATTAGTKTYRAALDTISNPDEIDINMLLIPGALHRLHSAVTSYAITLCEERGDVFYVMDAGDIEDSITVTTDAVATLDSNFTATYFPWVKINDDNVGRPVWVSPSVVIAGAIAYNDRNAAVWFAPAGLNRGGLTEVIEAYTRLTQSERDDLYENRVNPIATFPGTGVVAFGQKTLQAKPSALDRINVRRLLIALKKFIASSSKYLVFEQNTSATRSRFLNIVNPYLESVQSRSGLSAFKVVMDDSNNTSEVIDRNQLVGQIYIQPTRTAEFIVLDFVVLPTGATFPA